MKTTDSNHEFAFSPENLARAEHILQKYPADRKMSAILPLLDLAQRQNKGWLSQEAMDYVAHYLEAPAIKVYEVATFYSMFNTKPVGKNLIQICRTTPCWLCGSDKLQHAAEAALGVKLGETTPNGNFSLVEVECLGACVNAPVVQINDDYYENLEPEDLVDLLTKMNGEVT